MNSTISLTTKRNERKDLGMFVVDTNIFIESAIVEYPHHKKARNLLNEWRESSRLWHSTWSIFYEFLRVTTHPRILPKPLTSPEAWSFLSTLIDSAGFSLLLESDGHSEKVESLSEMNSLRGNLWHDAHIVAVMKESGIKTIYTADSDFHRFKGIEVINPLSA